MDVGDDYTNGFGGTSAAAPQVAGIAALILAINPDLTEAEVRDLIEQTADVDSGYNSRWAGHGRVNAYRALVRTLELHGGTLAQDVTVPAGETWNLGAVTLSFAPGTRLIVEGTLVADGTTFEEAETGQGWGGLLVENGGEAMLENGSVVRDVESFGGAAVTVFDGDLTLDDSDILGSTLVAEYAGTEHALFGWVALFGLAVEAGDVDAATEALAVAETSWPEAEATAMLQREHTLRLDKGGDGAARGAVAGRSGGASGVGAEAGGAATTATEFALYPAYPNPSSGAVTIPLALAEAAEVSVAVFDVLERRVAVLYDGRAEGGRHHLTLAARALPAGLYVVRALVRTDDGAARTFTRRVSVVR